MDGPPLTRSQAFEESENRGSNDSGNATLGDIVASRFSRRDLMRGALAVTAISATVSPLAVTVAQRAEAQAANATPSFDFKEIAAGSDERHAIAEGYDADILIRWGDPVLPGAPAFDPRATRRPPPGPAVRLQQRLSRLFPAARRGRPSDARAARGQPRIHQRGTDVPRPRPAGPQQAGLRRHDAGPWSTSRWRRMAAAVIEIRSESGSWTVVPDASYARRITANTPMRHHRPGRRARAAARPRPIRPARRSSARSTIAPAASRLGAPGSPARRTSTATSAATLRRGPSRDGRTTSATAFPAPPSPGAVSTTASTSARSRTRPNRFGWVVEIDPFDPASTPKKRTALGRFKHEGCRRHRQPDGRYVDLHGRRRALRVRLQVRHGRGRGPRQPGREPGHPRRGTLLRRALRRRRQRRLAAARLRPGTADGGERLCQPGRRVIEMPPRRRSCRRHEDGPAGGRRGQPEDRPGLRHADQQRPPQAKRGRRRQSARRQPVRPIVEIAPRRRRPCRRPRSHGRCWCAAATPASPRSAPPSRRQRRRTAGSGCPTIAPSTGRAGYGSRPTAIRPPRPAAPTASGPSRRRAPRGARPSSSSAARRGRNVRPYFTPGRRDPLRRRPAPRGSRRRRPERQGRHLRGPVDALAGFRARNAAAAFGGRHHAPGRGAHRRLNVIRITDGRDGLRAVPFVSGFALTAHSGPFMTPRFQEGGSS